jgi:putative YhdH/YhfP family quinone oxidoreductase
MSDPATGSIQAYLVTADDDGRVTAGPARIAAGDLPEGEVEIAVEWSSLNFKDTLAASGNRRVAGDLPHVPGIDAAGTVIADGTGVLVTGYGLGAPHWGGWSERIRVPAEWVHVRPDGMHAREAMQLGTAGLTAAMAVEAIERGGVSRDLGPILVTGATGGVGLLAVALLAHLDYHVVASTGKPDQHDLLKRMGATEVIDRDAVFGDTDGPLGSGRWAAAVDVVGGDCLAAVIRETRPRGVVAACGLVGGTDLTTTVYPFLLRGVTLAGIDSAGCPESLRSGLWDRLADNWALEGLDEITHEVTLEQLDDSIALMRAGQHIGRTIVRLGNSG